MTTKHNRRLRHHRHNKTAKRHIDHKPCCEHTFCGLQHWYKANFEKLGWMLLAKKNGWNDKVSAYVNSVCRLEDAIEHYRKYHAKDHDRKQDLMIMCDNVAVLSEHVKKDFY